MNIFDCLIIGAGIEGSATALVCAQRNRKTLLLEQFELRHNRGSSHGSSRITRYAYPNHKSTCTQMMFHAYPAWAELERSQNVKLFEPVGLLWYDKEASGCLQESYNMMKALNLDVKLHKPSELKNEYPNIDFDDTFQCLVDKTAGLLHADRCLKAVQNEFEKLGGSIKDKSQVINIDVVHDRVTVTCDNGQLYECRKLFVCVGSWAGEFCRQHLGLELPLNPVSIQICYWKDESVNEEYSIRHKFPCLIAVDPLYGHFYALPSMEHNGLYKFCGHGGVPISPERKVNEDQLYKACVQPCVNMLKAHFHQINNDAPAIVENCKYVFRRERQPAK